MSALNLQALAILSMVASLVWPAMAAQHTPQYVSLLAKKSEKITPTSGLQDIARKYNVSLNRAVGRSSCQNGKKCVGIVMLAGLLDSDLMLPSNPPIDSDAHACPQFGRGRTVEACNFLCGVFANVAHHVPFFKHLDSDVYSFDVVFMHDSSLTKEAVDLISAYGARTLLLDDSIKRKSCHAFLRRNEVTNFDDRTCDTAPFDILHFRSQYLKMFLQQLKLGAMGLFEYDAIAHVDVDMFITEPTSITAELDYYFSKDIQLLAKIGKSTPLNAAHWVARPSPINLDLWLKAVTVDGFNVTHGWGNAGMVVPDFKLALQHHSMQVHTTDWSFIGSDRDQGLLYYIFAIVLHGWAAEADEDKYVRDLHFPTASQVHLTHKFALFNRTGIAHMCGEGKPWDDHVCLDKTLTRPRVELLRMVLPQIVSNMEMTLNSPRYNSKFVKNFCYPRLFLNAKECAVI